MLPLATAILLALGGAGGATDIVRDAVAAALASPGARAEVLDVDPPPPARCAARTADPPRPIRASGRVAIRLRGKEATGRACDAWTWARVRVVAPALVARRAIAEGEPLDGAVSPVEREVEPGRAPIAELPEGARAARALAAGTPIDASSLRVGPAPGEPVVVAVRSGALSVEEPARAAACARGRACAVLPSGRRVEGAWHGGRIVLESP